MWEWLRNIVQHKKPRRTAQKPFPEGINSSAKRFSVQHKNKKRDRGRPRFLNKSPTSRVDFRINSSLLGKFRDYCKRHDISMTQAITIYMQRAITEAEYTTYQELRAMRLKPKKKVV